jgi:DNA repair protein RadC
MKISVEGHRQRLRDRVERMGADDMRPQDLMELLLYYALPRRDTKQQAFDIIEKFGSVRGVLTADEKELAQVEGVGGRTAHWLRILGELSDAYAGLQHTDRQRIDNVLRAQTYFRRFFEKCDYPEVWQCSLNTGGRLLSSGCVADNASWAESEYLREALSQAITSRAHSVVIGQFSARPGADFEEYDIKSTLKYAVTLSAAGIQLLDHMLICPDGVRSMFAMGLLDKAHCLTGINTLRENYLSTDGDYLNEDE